MKIDIYIRNIKPIEIKFWLNHEIGKEITILP